MDLEEFDLNLLLVFDRLVKTRKVSAVADALGVTQPAISRALQRLRATLGDELFFRTPAGMEPTTYAAHLAGPVSAALESLRAAIKDEFQFNPHTSQRNFTIRMTDIGELTILPRLLRYVENAAPALTFKIVRDNGAALKAEMEAGQIDLAIGLIEDLGAGFFRRPFFRQGYVCMFRLDHPLACKSMTRDDFERAEHVVVTAAGTGHTRIDELIEAQGVKRKIKLRVPNYASLELLLLASDLIATVPEALAQADLRTSAIKFANHPLELPTLPIELFWHARSHHDPANIWLRKIIAVECALPPIAGRA